MKYTESTVNAKLPFSLEEGSFAKWLTRMLSGKNIDSGSVQASVNAIIDDLKARYADEFSFLK